MVKRVNIGAGAWCQLITCTQAIALGRRTQYLLLLNLAIVVRATNYALAVPMPYYVTVLRAALCVLSVRCPVRAPNTKTKQP